jgi:CBS domain-containing protein
MAQPYTNALSLSTMPTGRMTAGRIRHLPVVQQSRLIGIVSIGDVVKSRVEEIDRETKTLRDYIQTA